MADLAIRPADASDRASLAGFVAALQDFETTLHSNRRRGVDIAETYLDWLDGEVAAGDGAIFAAEREGRVIGFVSCWAMRDDDMMVKEEERAFGYVGDLFVEAANRGRGVGSALLAAAEAYLARLGLTQLRISALAANADARAVYENLGYTAYEVVYEKRPGGHGA